MDQPHTTPPRRRTHRKRQSLARLSTDTTATLPAYQLPLWQRSHSVEEDPPSYPESTSSADEGDADSDSDARKPPHSPLSSPRRPKRFPGAPSSQPRKRQTGSTSDLDSLLQRSVHALEMSNALMQSSMSTQSSLSTLLSTDHVTDQSLERSARRISSARHCDQHASWMDDLDAITEGVNGLFSEEDTAESMVSQSLPTTSMAHRRRPSLNAHGKAAADLPHLHLSQQPTRAGLVAPPPRALTLHVASTDDPESLLLPSTLGLRSSPSSHSSDWRSAEPPPVNRNKNMPYSGFHTSASASLPVLTDRPSEPSTPAYNLLASFVTQQAGMATPNTPPKSSGFSFRRRGSSSSASTCTERGLCRQRSLDSRSRSTTPTRKPGSPAPVMRPMTPPIEELSASSSSSASSEHPHAYRTMQSLQKILDKQPAPVEKKSTIIPEHLTPPVFMPRSPKPVASSGTSTATASISRLLTRPRHHSSTQPLPPPTHSSLKQHSVPATPVASVPPSPAGSTLSFPELLGAGVARMRGSSPSSGRTTPSKRISFAALPESYASTRPVGSARFRDPRSKSKSKRKVKSQVDQVREREENGLGGWWGGWLFGAAGEAGYASAVRHEDRIEDRVTRSWGGRPGYGDEWAI
ncbi:hypothetical protein FIBSPDRAFT_841349 [Athelia psychrophila]|uniref:Uncharacterized protein n=1 Tax=Athelia psychrophila TaxID=1759441 RepID=A0A167XLR4_9AGAM|nr:hypothetical protein FIBSPDRAFT_841349 [Fibularhizoctonia sp. CBS 109695]